MNFAKSNIRISLSLSPEEPLITDDRLLYMKTLKILSAVTREFVSVAFAIPYHRNIPMDNYLQLLFLHSSPVGLVITRYPVILVVVSIILWAYCLAVPCHLNTPMDNSRTYRVSAHPQLFICFTMVFEILFDLPKILSNLLLLKFFACLHYG